MRRSIWIGYDPRPSEAVAFALARNSVRRHLRGEIDIRGLVLSELQACGLYRRPMKTWVDSEGHSRLIDVLSVRAGYDGSIATSHANARFLVPHLAQSGWALFMDGDMIVREDLSKLFEELDPNKAVYCVHHDYEPAEVGKMDGQMQTRYARKNWTSFIVWNCDHPANLSLTLDLVNTVPGRDLHALCWLADVDIGELPPEWNFLVGHHDPEKIKPKVIHYTTGTPDMAGYENVQFSELYQEEKRLWAWGG